MNRFIVLSALLGLSVAPGFGGFIPPVSNDPDFVSLENPRLIA
jgi:hypothetical protein